MVLPSLPRNTLAGEEAGKGVEHDTEHGSHAEWQGEGPTCGQAHHAVYGAAVSKREEDLPQRKPACPDSRHLALHTTSPACIAPQRASPACQHNREERYG